MLAASEGLKPGTIEREHDPLEWAERRRYFDGSRMRVPFPLRAIYTDTAPVVSVRKAAQMGFSEWAINLALWCADEGWAGRGNALYVLPGGEHVGDFVQARVTPAIQASAWLLSRIRADGDVKAPDKVGLRRIGRGHTYWRTGGSRAGLRTVDADVVILDEFDEMPAWVVSMAQHRLDSSANGLIRYLGTPTLAGSGIDARFREGDQRHFEIRCRTCETWQALEWDRNVEVAGDPAAVDASAAIVCVDCRDDLAAVIRSAWETGEGGRWRAYAPENEHLAHSYHLSHLYRPGADLLAIARALGSNDPSVRQEAHNQSLGMPYEEAGQRLGLGELRRLAVEPSTMDALTGTVDCIMGVDVGARLHVWIEAMLNGLPTLVRAVEVDRWEDVARLMDTYDVGTCVVDSRPELHAAEDFARAHVGRVFLADYVEGQWPIKWTDEYTEGGAAVTNPRERWRVKADRTAAIDAFVGMLRGRGNTVIGWQPTYAFPVDAEAVPGLFAMLRAAERRIVERADGRQRAIWSEGSRPDHYLHAGVYASLAREIGAAGPRRAPFDFV
jgi:hypothetical protein